MINGAPSRSCPAATPGLGFGARPINSTGYHGSRISIQAWCTMFVRHFFSWSFPDHWIRLYLVGGFNLPLWKMMEWKSVGMIIPFPIWWGKNNPDVPKHQPVYHGFIEWITWPNDRTCAMRIDQVDWGNEGSPLDGFSWHIRHDDLGTWIWGNCHFSNEWV